MRMTWGFYNPWGSHKPSAGDSLSTVQRDRCKSVIASQRVSRMRAPDERNSARVEMTGSAKQSISPRKERMDCFASLAMTANTISRSRGPICPRFARNFLTPPNQWAQGIPGARSTRSLACESKKHTSIVTTVTPESPGIPRAMVYGLYVLSSVTGLFCHRRLRFLSQT